MKIVIVGGSFAGIQAAISSRESYPQAEIILLEKEQGIGYIPGSLSLLMKGEVSDLDQLQWVTAEKLRQHYGIEVRCQQTVTGLQVGNELKLASNEIVSFDRLIIATGSGQFSHYESGKPEALTRILRFKTRSEAQRLLSQLPKAEKVALIGGGQVGLEVAEGLQRVNKEVHVFESSAQLLFHYLDAEMTEPLAEAVKEAGVHLHLTSYVQELQEQETQVQLITATEQFMFDLVLVATSTRPDNRLWQDSLNLNDDGTIEVDCWMQTSRTNVFAVGDAIQVSFQPTGEKIYSSLVNNALRTAQVAVANLAGPKREDPGTLRTIGNYLFGYYLGSTGLTESEGIFYPSGLEIQIIKAPVCLFRQEEQQIKLIFDRETMQLVGAQLLSQAPVLETINRLAEAIRLKQTKAQLAQAEEYFHPAFTVPQALFAGIEGRHEN